MNRDVSPAHTLSHDTALEKRSSFWHYVLDRVNQDEWGGLGKTHLEAGVLTEVRVGSEWGKASAGMRVREPEPRWVAAEQSDRCRKSKRRESNTWMEWQP